MKKKLTVIILLIAGIINADTLHIYLNTNNCRNCNLVGKQLESYTGIKKILYLTANDYRLKEDILESFNLNQTAFSVKEVSNSFFEGLDRKRISSYCVLQKGTSVSDTFTLGDMNKLDNYLQKPALKKIKPLKLDKNIKLSDVATASIYDDYILFQDDKLNKAYATKLKSDSIVLIEVIGKSNFKHEDFLKCSCFDEALYNDLLPTFKEMNLTEPQIQYAHIKNSVLNLMIAYNIGIIKTPSQDTIIFKKIFIYSKNLQNKKSSLTCVNFDGHFETDNILGKKFSTTNADFIKTGDTLYLPIISSDSAKKSLFVKQLVSGTKTKSLGITKDLNSIVPTSLKFTSGNNFAFDNRCRNETDYYFFITPLIYNIASKKTVFINNVDLISRLKMKDRMRLNYFINDAKVINGVAHLLIGGNNTWFKEEYDINTNQLIKSIPLEVDKSINVSLFMPDMRSFLLRNTDKNEFYISE